MENEEENEICKICFDRNPDAECGHCGELFHKSCCLEQIISEKRCPFCHKEYSFIDFRYLVHPVRLKQMFEKEVIETERELNRQIRPTLVRVNKLYRWVQKHRVRINTIQDLLVKRAATPSSCETREYDSMIRDLLRKKVFLVRIIDKLTDEVIPFNDFVEWTIDYLWDSSTNDVIGHCKCGGVILHSNEDSIPICDLCGASYCPKCGEEVRDYVRHKCESEAKLSYKSLMENTKACPKCGTRIEKAEGCNDIWCRMCYTGFKWDTREEIISQFHNPEKSRYFSSNEKLEIIDVMDDDELFNKWNRAYLFEFNRQMNELCLGTRAIEMRERKEITKLIIQGMMIHGRLLRFTFARLMRSYVRSRTRNIRIILYAIQTRSTYTCSWEVIESELTRMINECNLLAITLGLRDEGRKYLSILPRIKRLHLMT